MNQRVRAVIRKEFREYRRNKMIIITMGILPVVFALLPLIAAVTLPANASHNVISGIIGQATLFFFIAPLMIPTTVAAYAVIGEREQGTLEPVLTTPVSDRELVLGKAVSATIPGVAMSWVLFAVFATAIRLLAHPAVVSEFWRADRFAAEAFLAPAFAGFAIVVGLAISSRSNDIRVAQQLSALVMLPALGGIAIITYGAVRPSVGIFAIVALVVLAIDAAGWRAVVAMFDRERLLTRYQT